MGSGWLVVAFNFSDLVASQRHEAVWRLRAIGRVRPDRVQSVELAVQRVATIFRRDQRTVVGERQVIERCLGGCPQDKDRNGPAVAIFAQINTENRSPGSALRQSRNRAGKRIRIARGIEEESLVIRSRQELKVFGTLKRRSAG